MTEVFDINIEEAADDYSVLEINDTDVAVNFKLADSLKFEGAGPGDVRAMRDRGFKQFTQFLYEIFGRPEIQALLRDRGLLVERRRLKK